MVYRKRILVSFVAILIFPVLLDNILVFTAINDREMTLKRDYIYGQVKQLRSTVDYLINKVQSDMVFLSYKPELRNLRTWWNESDYRAKRAFFADFDPLNILATYYDEAYIVHPKDDIMLDLKVKLVSPIRGSRQENKIKAIEQAIASYVGRQELLISLSVEGNQSTYLIKPITIQETGNQMFLFIQFSDAFFKTVLDDTFLIDESYVLMVSHNDELIEMRSKDLALGKDSYQTFMPSADFKDFSGVATNSAGKFLVCFDESADNGWKYYYGINLASVQGSIVQLLVQFSILIIIILALFFVLVQYLSRGIYKPINDVMELIKSSDSDPTIMKDEFGTIQANISKLIERNHELRNSLDQNNRYGRNDFLKSLAVSNTVSAEEREEKIKTLKLDISLQPGTRYMINVLLTKGFRGYDQGADPEMAFGGKSADFLKNLVFKQGTRYEYFLADEKTLVFVLCMPEAEYKSTGQPRYLMEPSAGADPSLLIGVSAYHDKIEALHDAYKEARIAVEYRSIFQNRALVTYEEVLSKKKQAYFYPYDLEQKIIALLKQLDQPGLFEQFGHFTDTVSKSGVSFQNAKHIYFHLVDSLMQIVRDFDIPLESLNPDADRTIWDSLEDSEKTDDIAENIRELLGKILSRLESNKEAPTATIANAVKLFIDRNYNDKNLSLDLISSELKYSISHLSSIFKDIYGETIKNYITGLRLTKARDLLINSDQQISRISEEVGYDNIGSFVKIFKAYIGDTPKEYRLRIRRK